MKRHHRGSVQEAAVDSSSDEEDAFSALSRKKKRKSNGGASSNKETSPKIAKRKDPQTTNNDNVDTNTTSKAKQDASFGDDSIINANSNNNSSNNANNTSSNKRHHHQSSARAAKMDTFLKELEQTSKTVAATSTINSSSSSSTRHFDHRPPPDKMGSYVSIEEEPFTTNIFVGNLSPLTTEEQLTEIFRQFGDLYSVKIMWPRTPEEHARGRNTGFVCFMNRDDAQEAMDAYQERDPLRTGRRMLLRWGKNVKKTVKRGTGGVPIPPIRKKVVGEGEISGMDTIGQRPSIGESDNNAEQEAAGCTSQNDNIIEYDESKHLASAIKVITPKDQTRLDFITTVASFVAKDGSILEKRLLEREKTNPLFSFLHQSCENKEERTFYRWRVFAFTQGDSFDSWRTEPFIMIQPNGRFWIPPPLDAEKAMKEKMQRELKENQIRIKQERRRKDAEKKDFMTGRQLESMMRNRRDRGMVRLHPKDLDYWNHMIENKLCASRDAICEVMAFCFDKSGAAQHISELLKNILMDNRKGVSVETKIARLYLMSDILYNSQQPGVRNAFKYRDAIERMALEVFGRLGAHGNGSAGRITMNKLRNAVMAVLNAWTKWSVYNTTFLDQLVAAFDGKPIKEEDDQNEDHSIKIAESCEESDDIVNEPVMGGIKATEEQEATQLSKWVDKSENGSKSESNNIDDEDIDGEDLDDEDIENGFVDVDADLDGESLHDSDLEEEDEPKPVPETKE